MKTAIDWQEWLDAAAPGLVERCRLVGKRPRSVILRGRSPEFGEVCIKHDPRPGGLARMQAEHDALLACYRVAGETGSFGVPRPCALVHDAPDGAALVTSWIDCPRADERLARPLPFGSVREAVLHGAAGWLSEFHRLGGSAEAPLGSALDLPSLEADLRAACGRGGRNGQASAIDALADLVARSTSIPVRLTTIHGDYLPQNLFMCAERTVGIDFTLEVTGPALRDVGSFLANMVWRGYSTLDPRAPARFAKDADTFLTTYYGAPAPPEREVARFFILAELARKARSLSGKIADRRFRASDRLHRRMIVGAISQLLRQHRHAACSLP